MNKVFAASSRTMLIRHRCRAIRLTCPGAVMARKSAAMQKIAISR